MLPFILFSTPIFFLLDYTITHISNNLHNYSTKQ